MSNEKNIQVILMMRISAVNDLLGSKHSCNCLLAACPKPIFQMRQVKSKDGKCQCYLIIGSTRTYIQTCQLQKIVLLSNLPSTNKYLKSGLREEWELMNTLTLERRKKELYKRIQSSCSQQWPIMQLYNQIHLSKH